MSETKKIWIHNLKQNKNEYLFFNSNTDVSISLFVAVACYSFGVLHLVMTLWLITYLPVAEFKIY